MFLKTLKYFTVVLTVFLLTDCRKSSEATIDSQIDLNTFTHTSGKEIIGSNGMPVYLKGVAFGNNVWSTDPIMYDNDHSEIDFERVRQMGMNTVRFYLNYRFFESDNAPYQYLQSGWDWLDKNIRWAKTHHIFLILNMHVPQGGFQSQGNGDALWLNIENQNRLSALWKAIATRYKDENQIIGYGLINEPVPTQSVEQWRQLSQNLINAIRINDKNHIIFIERALYIKGNYIEDANYNFPDVQDSNLVYEFHNYQPFIYTHQLLDFTNLGDGGKYPDVFKPELTSLPYWYTATTNNPIIPIGDSNWHYYEGVKYQITDSNISIAYPALVGAKTLGSIYFDDLDIKEYDENLQFIRTVMTLDLNSLTNWNFWTANNQGLYTLSNQGHTDNVSLRISDATGDCNLSNQSAMFIPKSNYYYQINGWMKGTHIGQNAYGQFRLDFNHSDTPVKVRDKNYLIYILSLYEQWADTKKVPLYMGEFGAGLPCFEN
ncbi:MAG: cellulase family glycosylhydrolase, partial [Lutibacter sp.]|nr:cellulase family glycosylhydrolase [Lutibacter sp.]